MKMRLFAVLVSVLTLPGVAVAGDYVVPAFAYNLPGHAKNVWTTELYISNPGSTTVLVNPAVVLKGRLVAPHPCLPPIRPLEVPPHSSVVWTSAEIAFQLGCAEEIVGALLLHADGEVAIDSRMVNVSGQFGEVPQDPSEEVPEIILAGYSQQMPGIPVTDLPEQTTHLMLPSLIWHRNACDGSAFDSYVGFANPSDAPVNVTLDLNPELRDAGMLVDGLVVQLPFTMELPARSWRQIHITPQASMLAVCMDPERFDLYVTAAGPVAMYGSVVDRGTQDPRTVFPVALQDKGGEPGTGR